MAIIRAIDDGTGGLAEVSLHDDYCKIRVGTHFDDVYYNGVVVLDEEQLDELIQILQEFKKENFTNG
jgi:hypothetical protein